MRLALRVPVRDAAARESQVRAALGQLRTPDQFQRALLLAPGAIAITTNRSRTPILASEALVVDRFERDLRAALRQDDPEEKRTALRTVAVLDPSLRGTGDRPLVRDFSDDLAAFLASGPAPLREQAARTLGRINPDPATAAHALAVLLKDPEPRLRAAAGAALSDLMATAARLAASGARSLGDPEDLLRMACAVAPAAAAGLASTDPAARRPCAEAFCQCAEALGR